MSGTSLPPADQGNAPASIQAAIALLESIGPGTGTSAPVGVATLTDPGVVKPGTNLTVEEDGTLNAASPPLATLAVAGLMKVGANLTVEPDGTVNAQTGATGEVATPLVAGTVKAGTALSGVTLAEDGTLAVDPNLLNTILKVTPQNASAAAVLSAILGRALYVEDFMPAGATHGGISGATSSGSDWAPIFAAFATALGPGGGRIRCLDATIYRFMTPWIVNLGPLLIEGHATDSASVHVGTVFAQDQPGFVPVTFSGASVGSRVRGITCWQRHPTPSATAGIAWSPTFYGAGDNSFGDGFFFREIGLYGEIIFDAIRFLGIDRGIYARTGGRSRYDVTGQCYTTFLQHENFQDSPRIKGLRQWDYSNGNANVREYQQNNLDGYKVGRCDGVHIDFMFVFAGRAIVHAYQEPPSTVDNTPGGCASGSFNLLSGDQTKYGLWLDNVNPQTVGKLWQGASLNDDPIDNLNTPAPIVGGRMLFIDATNTVNRIVVQVANVEADRTDQYAIEVLGNSSDVQIANAVGNGIGIGAGATNQAFCHVGDSGKTTSNSVTILTARLTNSPAGAASAPNESLFYLEGDAQGTNLVLNGVPVGSVAYGDVAGQTLITPATGWDGLSRYSRDVVNCIGVCGSLIDATAAQYAAALEAMFVPWVRTNGIGIAIAGPGNGATSLLSEMQAIRSAQTALNSVRLALWNCLVMAYDNDTIPLTTQEPLMLAMIEAGVVKFFEGPNEINNPYTGGGSRGPNNSTDATPNGQYQTNASLWGAALNAFKAANLAAFNSAGVTLIGNTVAPIIGTEGDYEGMDFDTVYDYFGAHFYAGNGYQPSLPYGNQPGTLGYFSNVWQWAAENYMPTSGRQGLLTECGATTCGVINAGNNQYGYAQDGVSQSKYILNQLFEAFALNAKGVFIYQLFDGDGTQGDTEGNFGLYKTDKQTPKPAGLAVSRWQQINSVNMLPNSAANLADFNSPTTFKPGLDMTRLAYSGITNPPNGVNPVFAVNKPDGTTIVWVTNEPVIDTDATDVTPPACNAYVYLPHSYPWRIHDPLATDSLTAGAWTTSDTVSVTLEGYPMAIELEAPTGWTASAGDPADGPQTGSASFVLGQYNSGIAQSYGGNAPPDGFVQVGPPAGKTWAATGNFAVLIVATGTQGSPVLTCPQATITYGPFVETTSDQQIMVFLCPIKNIHQSFKVSGLNTGNPFGSMAVFEVPPFSNHGVGHGPCTYTGANNSTGNTTTAPLIAVPAGAIGLFAVVIRNESGQDSYSQSSDTTVNILNPLDENILAYFASFSGTIAAGRAAGNVVFPCSGLDNSATTTPTAVSLWFTK